MAAEQETISEDNRATISIDYNREDAIYNNGDIVEGFVVIHNTQEISIKSISVRCMGHAKFDSSKDQQNELIPTKAPISNSETYFDLMQTVLSSSDDNNGVTKLAPGNHRYSFHFQTPDEIPSSYSTSIGGVEYSCSVIVHLPGSPSTDKNYQYERPFVVVSRLDINTVANAKAPLGLIEKKKFHSLIFIPAGSIKVTALLNQKAYVLGDEIKMNILIENKYREIRAFVIYLRRVIAYYDANGQMTGNILPPVTGITFDYSLPTGRTSANDCTMKIPDDMPPTHLGRGCNIIKIGYFVEISLWTEKEPTKPPILHFVIPLFIGTQDQSQQSTTSTTTTTTTTTTTPSRTGFESPPPSYDTLNFPDFK